MRRAVVKIGDWSVCVNHPFFLPSDNFILEQFLLTCGLCIAVSHEGALEVRSGSSDVGPLGASWR